MKLDNNRTLLKNLISVDYQIEEASINLLFKDNICKDKY